ncbi:hypothetical protein RUM44_003977 [Polyplax serrata]|uniref:Uncharacterized protein n=1 Tax=Polyplax serrata TaxID=468196 RepID=A0ABR1B1L0_POLSC
MPGVVNNKGTMTLRRGSSKEVWVSHMEDECDKAMSCELFSQHVGSPVGGPLAKVQRLSDHVFHFPSRQNYGVGDFHPTYGYLLTLLFLQDFTSAGPNAGKQKHKPSLLYVRSQMSAIDFYS